MNTEELKEMIIKSLDSVLDDFISVSPETVVKVNAITEKYTDELYNILFFDSETVYKYIPFN